MTHVVSSAVRLWFPRVLLVALACIVLFEVATIASPLGAVAILGCAAWMALPGIVLVGRVCRARTSGHVASWLLGPALGIGFSVFGLLLFWAAGVQHWLALAGAPCFTWLLVFVAGRWGGPTLRLPAFDRRDVVAVALALVVVPAITYAPYDHVREPTSDGDAYRAYFTADFAWAMTVTSELAKGELPPVNPFLRGEPLHYYWMSHLLSGAVYRNTRGWGVTSEQVILLNGLVYGLVFVPFLYGLARLAGGGPGFSALAVVAAFTANSYEGVERMLTFRETGQPLSDLRYVNIDAVTRWYYQGMPVDGLQRMLLYQPHHLTGYMFSLAALWLVGFAEDVAELSVALWAGILLGLGLLFSTFTAIIAGPALAGLFAYRLIRARAWGAVWQAGVLGAMPLAVALALCTALGYADAKQGIPLLFGLNPAALRHLPWVLMLSLGPLLFAGIAGLLRVEWLKHDGAAALALVASALLFYFFADVPDQGGVWVGWRSGHLLLMGCAVMGAAVLTALWTVPWRRPVLVVLLVLLIVPAIPTVAIDVYNAQDITNRERGPSFPWTVIVTPQERAALDWIKNTTPVGAVVQTEPRSRHSGTWAFVQAFGERRGIAGLPGAMIPLLPYTMATDAVTYGIFRSTRAHDAAEMARFLGIDYLFVGTPERDTYPDAADLFAAHPEEFVPAFRNDEVAIYDVRRR